MNVRNPPSPGQNDILPCIYGSQVLFHKLTNGIPCHPGISPAHNELCNNQLSPSFLKVGDRLVNDPSLVDHGSFFQDGILDFLYQVINVFIDLVTY